MADPHPIPRTPDVPGFAHLPAAVDGRVAEGRSAVHGPSRDWRLHRHADYQRVYKATRKQHASLFTWFAVARTPGLERGPRVGLTAGRVLGNAVERNRIKRRMRASVRENLALLIADVDLVLHPKRSVLEAEYSVLTAELRRIFLRIQREMGLREAELPAATSGLPETPASRGAVGPPSRSTDELIPASMPGSTPGAAS
jgi:ribonuclease P protein component